ncbi:MAG: SulP family inorganic anion transporter [Myxococcota bacterium]
MKLPSREELVGDVWGGLAAMLVAVPSAIAFGVTIFAPLGAGYAAEGALAGMIGATVLGIVSPLLGGSQRLVTTPCAPAAAVMGALAAELVKSGDATSALGIMVLVAALSGLLQLAYGLLGGGRIIKYIPYPVVSGYLSGVAVLILLKQFPGLLGLPSGAHFWESLASPGAWQATSVAVGVVTMAATGLAPRLTKAVPAPIIGLAAGVATYFGAGLLRPELLRLDGNAFVIGPVGGGGGSLLAGLAQRGAALGRVGPGDLAALIVPALTLSALLSIDTLKTCVIVDALTRTRHDSNRVLCAQGLGNFASALAGGVPGAGQMGATLVNVSSGGRTRLSGVLVGVFSLATIVLLGRLIAWIPVAALAGILLVVAWRMFDRSSFHLARHRATLLDFAVIAAVVAVAVGVSLIAASGVGFGLAILLFVREQMRASVVRRETLGSRMFSKQRRLPEEMAILEREGIQTDICELQGSLFFGTTDQLLTELDDDLKVRRYIILDMKRVQSVDYTAAHMLEQIAARLSERGGHLLFAGLPRDLPTGQDLHSYFEHLGVGKSSGTRFFGELDEALEWVEERLLAEARPGPPDEEKVLELHEIDLLREFEADTLAAVREGVRERSCAAGEKLFATGDAGDEMFLIRRGKVRIVLPLDARTGHHLASFGRGDYFGEMAFLDRGGRSADAVAVAPTDLYVLSRARFDAVSHAHPVEGAKIFARIARALALRLRHTDAEVRALQGS